MTTMRLIFTSMQNLEDAKEVTYAQELVNDTVSRMVLAESEVEVKQIYQETLQLISIILILEGVKKCLTKE